MPRIFTPLVLMLAIAGGFAGEDAAGDAPVAPVKWADVTFAGTCLDVFPENTVIAVGTQNAGRLLQAFTDSMFGKLLAGEQLASTRSALQTLAKDAAPEVQQQMGVWLNKFTGSAAAGVWNFAPPKILETEAGAVLEITAADPAQFYAEFLKLSGADQFTATVGKDGLPIQVRLLGLAAVARVGKFLLLGTNKVTVEKLAAALRAGKPAGLTANARYQKATQGLPPTELQALVNYPRYLEVLETLPGGERQLNQERLLGRDSYDLTIYTLARHGEIFDEKLVTLYRDMEMEDQADDDIPDPDEVPPPLVAPLDASTRVPHNALISVQFEFDGSLASVLLDEYLPVLEDYVRGEMARVGATLDDGTDFSAAVTAFEELAGIGLDELLEGVDGRHTAWLMPPPLFGLPDIGMSLECIDEEAADKLATDLEDIAKRLLGDPAAVAAEDAGDHKLYALNMKSLGERVKKSPPYQLCWCALGNSLIVSSSTGALRTYLSGIDKHVPMLAARPDYVRSFEGRTEDEKDGQLLYVDLKTTLGLAQTYLLPMAGLLEPALGPAIVELPPADKLFTGLPPLVSFKVEEDEPWRQIITVRSPLPALPGALGIGVLGGYLSSSLRKTRERN